MSIHTQPIKPRGRGGLRSPHPYSGSPMRMTITRQGTATSRVTLPELHGNLGSLSAVPSTARLLINTCSVDQLSLFTTLGFVL